MEEEEEHKNKEKLGKRHGGSKGERWKQKKKQAQKQRGIDGRAGRKRGVEGETAC